MLHFNNRILVNIILKLKNVEKNLNFSIFFKIRVDIRRNLCYYKGVVINVIIL